MNIESNNKKESLQSLTAKDDSGAANVPSGFILKLYQMVNGAPDEVITVSTFLRFVIHWPASFVLLFISSFV